MAHLVRWVLYQIVVHTLLHWIIYSVVYNPSLFGVISTLFLILTADSLTLWSLLALLRLLLRTIHLLLLLHIHAIPHLTWSSVHTGASKIVKLVYSYNNLGLWGIYV